MAWGQRYNNEEHEENRTTKRLIPWLSFTKSNFISRPIFISANFI
jgi:hypothetical protein